jgi:hypothetical protein
VKKGEISRVAALGVVGLDVVVVGGIGGTMVLQVAWRLRPGGKIASFVPSGGVGAVAYGVAFSRIRIACCLMLVCC